jgi:hypothetical protein
VRGSEQENWPLASVFCRGDSLQKSDQIFLQEVTEDTEGFLTTEGSDAVLRICNPELGFVGPRTERSDIGQHTKSGKGGIARVPSGATSDMARMIANLIHHKGTEDTNAKVRGKVIVKGKGSDLCDLYPSVKSGSNF